MYTLATLNALRQHLGLSSSDTSDDARLLAVLQAASAAIERIAARRFCPYVATLSHIVERFDTKYLTLCDDLLSLIALVDGDGTSINLNDVEYMPSIAPHSLLHLTNERAFIRSYLNPVAVTGVWGWHDRVSEMWRASGDTVQNNPLSNSGTSLTVTSVIGSDSAGESPRFQVGHLLKIEDEYLRVLAINSNTLTVLRGVNGTTAAQHNQNTPIYTFQPIPDVHFLTLRWATWLYRESDTRTPPRHLNELLLELRRTTVSA